MRPLSIGGRLAQAFGGWDILRRPGDMIHLSGPGGARAHACFCMWTWMASTLVSAFLFLAPDGRRRRHMLGGNLRRSGTAQKTWPCSLPRRSLFGAFPLVYADEHVGVLSSADLLIAGPDLRGVAFRIRYKTGGGLRILWDIGCFGRGIARRRLYPKGTGPRRVGHDGLRLPGTGPGWSAVPWAGCRRLPCSAASGFARLCGARRAGWADHTQTTGGRSGRLASFV